MARIYLVTSFKGGVGKSTVSANIANKLSAKGKRVLLCDLDFDLSTLDLITGCEDRLLFDICDAAYGRKPLEDCVISFPSKEGLHLLGAPYKCTDDVDSTFFASKLIEFSQNYDYVILDTPGADSKTLEAASLCADQAIVVATQQPTSLRGAEKTADKLRERGIKCKLIINCFDSQSVLEKKRTGIISMIDSTKTPLLGVIPYDRTLMFSQEKGVLADGDGFPSSRAFENVASRMEAEVTGRRLVPVLYGVKGIKRKKVLTK